MVLAIKQGQKTMKHFSEKLTSTNDFLIPEAPAWLRLKYIRDVFNHFIPKRPKHYIPDYEDIDYEEEFSIPLDRVSEDICIQQRLDDIPNNKTNHYEFITNIIKECDWQQFYDIIEIVGQVILSQDLEIIHEWDDAYIIDSDERNDMDSDFNYRLAKIRLDDYSFDTYLEKVNRLLSTSELPLFFMDNGELGLHLEIDKTGKPIANMESNVEIIQSVIKVDARDEIEEFLGLV